MKTMRIYIILLLSSLIYGACTSEIIDNEIRDTPSGVDGTDKKDVFLLRFGDDAEVKDVTTRLLNNIPVSWEIGDKKIVEFDQLPAPQKDKFDAYVQNTDIYLTVIINIDDVISGKYPAELFRKLKYYKRDFYIIATHASDAQKQAMLNLIGVYLEEGYYAINYDNVQHYRIFPASDPYAKNNMIGQGVNSFVLSSQEKSLRATGEPGSDFNRQMADKEALKRIEIYNRIYGYAKGGGSMEYSIDGVPYKMRDKAEADVVIDNAWSIDAYNFQIYSKNNNCILNISNTTGNGFTSKIADYTSPKTFDVYAYIWNLMQEASSEITVHADSGIFREFSYQPQTVNHGAQYTENSFWKVSVSLSPEKLVDAPWEAFGASFSKESSTDVEYKTLSMDVACKGVSGNGFYGKRWQFVPGQFYDKAPAFVYETSSNLRMIDAVQAMTPNYVTWGGWTLRQNYPDHINNSMKLHKQQAIYTLGTDAQPGVVSVSIKDAIKLQKTQVHYNCGIRYGHQSTTAKLEMQKMVWIDFRQWNN